METHQPLHQAKKSDILPVVAPIQSRPFIAQPKIESTRSNEEQLAQIRAKREASERLGSTLLIPESVPHTPPPLQPKLTIGQPGDMYEQEADRVARQVVDQINAPPKIQAKAPRHPMQSVGERKPSPLDHHPVMKVQRHATGGEMDASPDLESSIQRSRGGGQPLDDGIRERMEGAFGADFSGVRVHTDGTSDQLNQSIQAKAFTTGQDVFFRKGMYDPGSRGGQELLAHELTHVVQQTEGAVRQSPQHSVMETKSAYEGHKQSAELKPISANGSKEVIQRDVGFEFELDSSLTTYKGGLINGYNSLKKKDRIVNGLDFYVEADGLPGGQTSWEFVTQPFPETMVGLNRLIAACQHIDGIVDAIRQSPVNAYNLVDNAFLNGHGAPVNNKYFRHNQQVHTTKPQVTAGFALDALDELYYSASTAPRGGASNLVRDTNNYQHAFGQVNPAHPIDNALGAMRTEANNAIIARIGNVAGIDKLRGLVTHLMQIIIGGQQPIGVTPKTIMRLALGRSDMSTAFNTLPPEIRNPLVGSPDVFENIVIGARCSC